MDLPLAELKTRLGSLPDTTAVIYTGIYYTSEGVSYVPAELTSQIAEWANRPVVINVSSYLNKGAVGGYIVQANPIGQQAGRLALRILGGENASDLQVVKVPSPLIFEWLALQRWKISESVLPPGSEILFRPPTAWEQYRWQILLIIAVVFIQTLLILGLLYEHQRRRRAELQSLQRMAELAHLNRVATVGELSASIAHEVKQPLAAVVAQGSAALRWLAHTTPDLNEAQAALNKIIFAGNRAGEIVDNLRSMFRKESSGHRPLDINNLLANVIALIRHDAPKHGILVHTKFFDGPKLQALGDQAQLEQVFLNLVMNAIEAMNSSKSDHRVLELKTSVNEGDEVLVTVADSGPGVDAKNLERIFDAFFTTKPNGMGMGLSICRTIVEAHKGSLTVVPNKPKGVEFRIILPIAA
jgi:signal transduction histidine kinase